MLKKNTDLKKWVVISSCFGAFFFLIMCGGKIINPLYYDWILNSASGDAKQCFFGWLFYEKSLWSDAMFGTVDTTYPHMLSLIFSDAIVPFAVLGKLLFGSVIPEGIITQYIGLWSFLNYILQGYMSGLIVYKMISNLYVRVFGIIVFCASPVIMQRLFVHNTLIAHWLILAAFCLCLYRDELRKKKYLLWIILIIFGTSIHLYFMPILCLIMCFELLSDVIRNRHLILPVFTFVLAFLGSIFLIYILGGFSSEVSEAAPEWSYTVLYQLNSNLNTLFNSMGKSLFIPSLPQESRQYEGYGYLGAGVLILIILSIVLFLKYPEKYRREIEKTDFICIFVCIFVSFSIAIGPRVTFFNKLLFQIKTPKVIDFIFATFRSTGRFIWIVDYLLVLIFLSVFDYYGCRLLKKNMIRIIAISLTVIQLVDLSPVIVKNHKEYAYLSHWDSCMIDKKWKKLADTHDYVYAITADLTSEMTEMSTSMLMYVYKNNMKITSTRCAHESELLRKESYKYMDEILEGNIKQNVIYWFVNEDYMNEAKTYLHTEIVDGYCIGWVE